MISGILSALILVAASPNKPELDAWLKPLAEAAPTELRFVETRDSGLLTEPLEVRGRLARDGDRLVRSTTEPRRETQTLSEGSVELRNEQGHRQRFAIRRAPELAALREALLAILDGDAERLEQHFAARLHLDDEHWRLELEPRAKALAERVTGLTISGVDQRIDWLELHLSDGESIRTEFEQE
jgi:hypothetical protein